MARVRFAARATANLRAQVAFLRERDPRAAAGLAADVARAALLLSEHPLAGPALPGRRPARVRLTTTYRYRMVYRVLGDDVLILDILHPSRGPWRA